jgi:hypothetical protein
MTMALGVSISGPSGQKSSAFASAGRIAIAGMAHITPRTIASARFQYFGFFHVISHSRYLRAGGCIQVT